MGITINFFGLSLSGSHPQDGSADLVIGPLQVWLGGAMQGITWKGRFDFICEKTDYRPEGGKWFEAWTDSYGASCGYLLGRQWRLLTVASEAGQPGPQMGTAG